ncbi:MAG: aspartyl protease family protein [Nonlabens sp.]
MPEGVDEVEIPVESISSLLLIKAQVNGVTMKFILDTGATTSTVFNLHNVDSLIVGEGKRTTIRGYGSLKPFEAIESYHNEIKIGELQSLDATLNILTETQISFLPILGTEVNGLLGNDFFKNYFVELNYRKNKVVVHRSSQRLRLHRYDAMEIDVKGGKMFISGMASHNSSEIDLSILLDTGSGDALWIFEKHKNFKLPKKGFRDYLGFGISGDVYGFRSKLNQLQFGNFLFEKITFAFPELNQYRDIVGKKPRGSLGGEVFRRFNVIIDYQNQVAYFKKNRAFKDGFYYNMAGLKLREGEKELITKVKYNYDKDADSESRSIVKTRLNDNKTYLVSYAPKILVSYVAPDSPADEAGIMKGDQIVGFFKKDLGEFSMGDVSENFYRNPYRKLYLRLKRQDKFYEANLFLKPIIE